MAYWLLKSEPDEWSRASRSAVDVAAVRQLPTPVGLDFR
jgi:predicted RNA-binding protein with PUA-like domain